MEEAIKRLKEMLRWSDRIGSDEIFEIQQITQDCLLSELPGSQAF